MIHSSIDSDDHAYLVLMNDEGHYQFWPLIPEIPAGWTIAHGPDSRRACINFIGRQWTVISRMEA